MEENNPLINNVQAVTPFRIINMSDDISFDMPKESGILAKKSDEIESLILEQAQERQDRWRKRIKQKQKRESMATVRDRLRRVDDTVIDEKVERRQKEIAADKQKRAKIAERKRDERLQADKAELNRRRELNKEIREEKEAEAYTERQLRARERRIETKDPAERRVEVEARLESENEKALERRKKKQEEQAAAIQANFQEKRETNKQIREDFLEERLEIKELEKRARKRAEYNESLEKPLEERKAEKDARLEAIDEKGSATRNKRLEIAKQHFERMAKRAEEIIATASEKRIAFIEELEELTKTANEKAQEILIASGHPIALKETLSALDYFILVREHVDKIINDAHQNALQWRDLKNAIDEHGARIRYDHGVISGNPRYLLKELGKIEFHLQRKQREIDIIIENARKRIAEKMQILGLPGENKKEALRILHRLMGYLSEPTLLISNEEETILAIARQNPVLITRRLVERVVQIFNSADFLSFLTYSSAAGTNEKGTSAYTSPSIEKLREKSNRLGQETELILKQENLKAIFSGMLTDPEIKTEALLDINRKKENSNSLDESEKAKGFSFTEDIINLITQENKTDAELNPIIDLTTPVDPSTELFNTLQTETDISLFKDRPPAYETFQLTPYEEIERKHELEEKEQLKEKQEKKRLEKRRDRRAYLLKMIEEQNTTAQEKLNNERNLIDLMF